jgi:hypothetical protein
MEEETCGTVWQINLVGQTKPVVFSGSSNLPTQTPFLLTDALVPYFVDGATALRYRYSPDPETQGAETPPVADDTYHPQPPKPFVSRGRSGKHAGRLHEYYLQKREKILTERHNKNMRAQDERAEPTAEEQQASHRRRSDAAKRWQKEMSSEAKAASRRRMDAGRAVQLARYKAERREWEAITLRVNGESLKDIATKLGGSRQRVSRAVRSVDLPEGKRYLCDRGQPSTHESAIELCKMLCQSSREFAALISTPNHPVQERRVVILYTNRQGNLDPAEAQLCIDLRDRAARALLSHGKYGLDGYDRREVLAALFPRYREEYQMLRATLRGVRGFLAANPDAQESGIAGFVIGQAQAEKRGEFHTSCYRELIRWLPERPADRETPKDRLPRLMPVIFAHRADIAGSRVLNLVAVEVLADTIGAPAKIAQKAIVNHVKPAPPKRIRELLRLCPELAQPAPAIRPKPRKIREPRKIVQETSEYKLARAVDGILPKCQEAIQARRASQKSWPADKRRWESEIRKVGFTAQPEIDILIRSRTPAVAAANIIATRKGLIPKSVQNAWSAHKKSFQ